MSDNPPSLRLPTNHADFAIGKWNGTDDQGNATGILSAPRRIQRKRVQGWRMPPNTVYVGRPTTWGNPYGTPDDPFHETADEAVKAYRWYLAHHPDGVKVRKRAAREVRGKTWPVGAHWIGRAMPTCCCRWPTHDRLQHRPDRRRQRHVRG